MDPKRQVIGTPHYDPARANHHILALRQALKQQHEENVAVHRRKQAPLYNVTEIDYPIPAIRAWDLRANLPPDPDVFLTALSFQYLYDGPVARQENSPVAQGSTGYWAVKPRGYNILIAYDPAVIGFVELTGDVVEHELGWRGEVMVIQELFMRKHKAYARRIEQKYQCEVHTEWTLDDLMRRFK